MTGRPKYSVGTRIMLLGEPPSNAGEFAIISRHFLNTNDPHYRIRSLFDCHEQAVGEDDIVTSLEAMPPVEGRLGSKVVPFRRLL